MNIHEAISLGYDIINEFPSLYNWTVTSNNRKRAFGLCSHSKEVISLSSYLVPQMTDKAIKNTIIHEIAHALTPFHGHDNVWRDKCISLGGNGKRCSGAEVFKGGEEGMKEFQKLNSKYVLTCPDCNNKVYLKREPKRGCSCGEHGVNHFEEKYRMVLSLNE